MRKGYKITLGILTIMILVTITIGTSYSYYSVSDVQTDYNTLATTCFDITYSDRDVIKMNSDGNYAYPMDEADALTKTPYSLTITNTCTDTNSSAPIKYDLSINTLTSPTSNLTPYIRYKLGSEASAVLTTKLDSSMASSLKSQYSIANSYKLTSGTLAPGASVTYNLNLWIDANAGNDIMGNTFTGKVLVYAYM